MKLILAILRDEDLETISHELITAGFRLTRIATTGGFLRRGNTTFMIGVDDDKVDQAIEIMKEHCSSPTDSNSHRATIFVLNVSHYAHF
jgi:uncharacterized protein YaaQ